MPLENNVLPTSNVKQTIHHVKITCVNVESTFINGMKRLALKKKLGILLAMEATNAKQNSAMLWINCVYVHQMQTLMEITTFV